MERAKMDSGRMGAASWLGILGAGLSILLSVIAIRVSLDSNRIARQSNDISLESNGIAQEANDISRSSQKADVSITWMLSAIDPKAAQQPFCRQDDGSALWSAEFVPVFGLTNNGAREVSLIGTRYVGSIVDGQYAQEGGFTAYAWYYGMTFDELKSWLSKQETGENEWFESKHSSLVSNTGVSGPIVTIAPGETYYVYMLGRAGIQFKNAIADEAQRILEVQPLISEIEFIFDNSTSIPISIYVTNPANKYIESRVTINDNC